jgi:hypothetical protein
MGTEIEIAPMPPEELDEAIAAHQLIAAMAPDERERRVRREYGDAAFDPTYVIGGAPHDELLFLTWGGNRWAAEEARVANHRTIRAMNAAAWVTNLRGAGTLPGKRLEAPGVDPQLLEALAGARLTMRPDASDDAAGAVVSDDSRPWGTRVMWDVEDLQARLVGPRPKRAKGRRTR